MNFVYGMATGVFAFMVAVIIVWSLMAVDPITMIGDSAWRGDVE